MAKSIVQTKQANLCMLASCALLMFCAIWTLTDPSPIFSTRLLMHNSKLYTTNHGHALSMSRKATYKKLEKRVTNWDEKRRELLKRHSTLESRLEHRVLVLTGSQPSSCKNPLGDHLLLRFFKNKVDYCRIHGYDIFYNNAILNPVMRSFWAKIPMIRAAMLAHPDKEWIFWVDSDAIFTDMEFKVPLDRYKDHNLVVHGWPNLIYEKKSWVAVNAGIFLIRNCQWSMEFLKVWADMGPASPNYAKWGQILKSTLKDKMFPQSDDQSALIYLLLKEKKKWGDMIYVENEYFLHGYWVDIVGKFDNFTKGDDKILGRPFVTHFTGCQPCSGEHNPTYEGGSCKVGMERALNFADNQVLRGYKFVHPDIGDGSFVTPLLDDFT